MGKRTKKDIAFFELYLEDNLFRLHWELSNGNEWKPDPYSVFFVQDPKLRKIHKASVRDRVLYQALYQALYQVFDSAFIYDSYSSRNRRGTHRAVERFASFARTVSQNYTKRAFVLKCDIRKFFDSVDHDILLKLISQKIDDQRLLKLIEKIVFSFKTINGKGLPLGNVTSQLFANVYLNELDQYIKHELKAKYYIRYCDDFVFIHDSDKFLEILLKKVDRFCREKLRLELHPQKIIFRKIHQGVDFLGYVSLPHRLVVRTKTKRRILSRINERNLASYLGICSHAKEHRFTELILKKQKLEKV